MSDKWERPHVDVDETGTGTGTRHHIDMRERGTKTWTIARREPDSEDYKLDDIDSEEVEV